MSRLLIANFAAEIELARRITPGPHRSLPTRIGATIAAASQRLAALARPGDRLWTMAPVTDCPPGLACTSQPLDELPPCDAVLAWCETDAVHRLRRRASPPAASSWRERLFYLGADPDVCARVNHRRFAHELSRTLGCPFPGELALSSVGELERAVKSVELGEEATWVLKAPLAAAGREQLRRRGRHLDDDARVRAERLLRRYGEAFFEPWVPRTADLGVAGIVEADGLTLFAPHRCECDRQGVFRRVIVDDASALVDLPGNVGPQISDTACEVGRALAAAGYLGAFNIDAFLYRRGSGLALRPLCEINARLSFGLLARADAEARGVPRAVLDVEAPPRRRPRPA